MKEAEKVLANTEATQEEIDAALTALQTAQNGLVKKPEETEKPIGTEKPVETDRPTEKPSETPVPAVGKTYDVNRTLRYKVTKSASANGTVTVVKLLKKNKAKVVVPATVKLNGYIFKVTAVSPKAFAKCKKLKSVTIGKNVASIGKKAFFQCTKLKTIIFKGKKAPKIGKQAFKGIRAKCKIMVSKKMVKKQLSRLKVRIKKAGIGSRAVYKQK